MKILLVNHYAGSPEYGMEYRPYYMSREWVRMGCKVTIVAASKSHLRAQSPNVEHKVTEEEIDGIRYLWLRTPPYHGNGLGRVFNMMTFVGRLMRRSSALAAAEQPDVVIASSTYPLDIHPAYRIARRCGAKLVFEVHDLWPLTPMKLGGMSRWHPFIMLLQRAEDFSCRRADKIVSMLPRADLHLATRGMDPAKFECIPNGVVVDADGTGGENRLPKEHQECLATLKKSHSCLIGYTGSHGIANALDTLLGAAHMLKDLPLTFVLVGQGPHKEELISKKEELGLENVVFLPPVPKTSIPGLLSQMDFLYVGWNRSPLYRYGISPNKLMDYMLAAKPILHSVEAANDPVAESGCGLSVPPRDPAAIAQGVRHLVRTSEQERRTMGQRGKDYVIRYHDYRVLASRFLDVIS